MTYYPYGEERTSTADGRDKFGTYMRDSVTQDYADQRYYNVGMGRFSVPDRIEIDLGAGFLSTQHATIGFDSSRPGSTNHFAFGEGDPVNFNDPDGRSMTYVGYGVCYAGRGADGVADFVKCDYYTYGKDLQPEADPSSASFQRAAGFMKDCLANLDHTLALQRSIFVAQSLRWIGINMLNRAGNAAVVGALTGGGLGSAGLVVGAGAGAVGGAALTGTLAMITGLINGLETFYLGRLPEYDRTVITPALAKGIKDCQDGADKIAQERSNQ
jgi:RHS repeat-associated protein